MGKTAIFQRKTTESKNSRRSGPPTGRGPALLVLLLGWMACNACVQLPAVRQRVEGYEGPGIIRYEPELLARVAAALKKQGLYAGNQGAVYGLALQGALRSFQNRQSLPVTGRIDEATLSALGLEPGPPSVEPGNGTAFSSFAESWQRRLAPRESSSLPASDSALYHRAAAVAALVKGEDGEPFCTGFLIGPDLLLTAGGCLSTRQECRQTVARFNYQSDAAGIPLPTTDYGCQEVLRSNPDLGYTVVKLAGMPGFDWGYLEISDVPPSEGDRVTVIGHPPGKMKQVLQTCRIEQTVDDLAYACEEDADLPGAAVLDHRTRRAIGLGRRTGEAKSRESLSLRRILADCPQCIPLSGMASFFSAERNGRADLLLAGHGRVGLLRSSPDGFESEWLPADWPGRWSLTSGYRVHVMDLDGDGLDEILLNNSHWLAIFKKDAGQWLPYWIAHERVDAWELGADDKPLVGDFNGDGRNDLLLINGRQMGMLLSDGEKLTCRWRLATGPANESLGQGCQPLIGDFDGDGRDELLLRRQGRMGLFRIGEGGLETIWASDEREGIRSGGGEGEESFSGDFDGDGRDELLVRFPDRLTLWTLGGEKPEIEWQQKARLGSWRLGWQDQFQVADFNGDGRDDLLVRNYEWLGLLLSTGRFFIDAWLRFDRAGNWDLTPFDRELVGDFNGDGLADLFLFNPWASCRFLSDGTALRDGPVRNGPLLSAAARE